MRRQIPDCPDAPEHPNKNDITSKEFDIHVVTPLFGGGVEAGKNDPITLIRGSSIRGHLRFWWRATRGAAFETWQDLKKAEEAIWGSSEQASPVSIQVRIKNSGKVILNYKTEKQNAYPDYALFPFQGMGQNGPQKCREGIIFNLKIYFSNKDKEELYKKDVEAAVWAWINLGGIGARTRRGVGALYSNKYSPDITNLGTSIQKTQEKIQAWYDQKLEDYNLELSKVKNAKPWPLAPTRFSVDGIQKKPIECWKEALDLFKKFRQGEEFGRNRGKGRTPGRSRWPEADSIRKITGKSNANHKSPITPTVFFPRAAFGLPIQFRFNIRTAPGDPAPYVLVPDIKDSKEARMASPMILKPLALSPTQAIGLSFNLITQFNATSLKLSPVGHRGSEHKDTEKSWKIMDPSLIKYSENHTRSPYQHCSAPQNTRGLASNAFIIYFRERGLKK